MKVLVFFSLFTFAFGNLITRRAGAPEAVPLPSNCMTHNPLLALEPANYAPSPSLVNKSAIYAFYLQPDTPAISGGYTKCLQQCYGLGNGTCKSVFYASAVPRPPMFGSPGGGLTTACLMFDRTLMVNDFVVAKVGTYESPVAACLHC